MTGITKTHITHNNNFDDIELLQSTDALWMSHARYRVQTRCGCGLLLACVPVIEYRRVVDVACCWLVYLLQSTDALWMWPAAGLCTCYRVQTRCGCGLLLACVPVTEYRRVVDVACCWLVYLLQSTDALWMWPAAGLCTCYRVQTRCGCGLLLACVPVTEYRRVVDVACCRLVYLL